MALLPDAFFVSPGTKDKNCYGKIRINATEAEIGKYAANVFGYIKVIFGNILADIAHGMEQKFKNNKTAATVSYKNISEMLGHDRRIGMSWLNVNHGNYCGAGGYCFPQRYERFYFFFGKTFGIRQKNQKVRPGIGKIDRGRTQSFKIGARLQYSTFKMAGIGY